jgi:hypothetical protein
MNILLLNQVKLLLEDRGGKYALCSLHGDNNVLAWIPKQCFVVEKIEKLFAKNIDSLSGVVTNTLIQISNYYTTERGEHIARELYFPRIKETLLRHLETQKLLTLWGKSQGWDEEINIHFGYEEINIHQGNYNRWGKSYRVYYNAQKLFTEITDVK